MKFKVKSKPELWDRETFIKFAWFPMRVDDHIVWLEKYKSNCKYEKDWFWGSYYWEEYSRELIVK